MRVLILFALLLTSCAPAIKGNKILARVTAYCPQEDKVNRNKISTSIVRRAVEGRTAAVSPYDIPYFSKLRIPGVSKFGIGHEFIAEDTGGALKTRKASKGKTPVIDIYLTSLSKVRNFEKIIPEYLEVYVETN